MKNICCFIPFVPEKIFFCLFLCFRGQRIYFCCLKDSRIGDWLTFWTYCSSKIGRKFLFNNIFSCQILFLQQSGFLSLRVWLIWKHIRSIGRHYNDVIMALQRLKSPTSWLFTQSLFTRRSKKTSKFLVTGLCAGNSPGTVEFPA